MKFQALDLIALISKWLFIQTFKKSYVYDS